MRSEITQLAQTTERTWLLVCGEPRELSEKRRDTI